MVSSSQCVLDKKVWGPKEFGISIFLIDCRVKALRGLYEAGRSDNCGRALLISLCMDARRFALFIHLSSRTGVGMVREILKSFLGDNL